MTYVLSDIHGQMRRFQSIMKQINLQPEDTLYVLGDVIDRYPDGIKILRQLMVMPNVKLLLGNHEFMMLNALYYPQYSKSCGGKILLYPARHKKLRLCKLVNSACKNRCYYKAYEHKGK